MVNDVQAIQELIRHYHQTLSDNNLEVGHACFAPERFRFVGNESNDPCHWAAVGFFSMQEIRQWENALPDDYTYINHIEFLNVDVQDNFALAVTSETGSTSWGSQWEAHVNVWFVSKIEAQWKIIGSFHRDDSQATFQ